MAQYFRSVVELLSIMVCLLNEIFIPTALHRFRQLACRNSVTVVLVRLESVLSSVTLWITCPKPLGALANFTTPVPETPKSGT